MVQVAACCYVHPDLTFLHVVPFMLYLLNTFILFIQISILKDLPPDTYPLTPISSPKTVMADP